MEQVLAVNKDSYHAEVIAAKGPVLVDFWAPWCGPCRMVAPVLAELAAELAGKLKVVKVNVDENQELAAQYNIMSIPTIMLVKDGEVVQQMAGFMPKTVLLNKIQEYL